jgi:surface-anchored protein
MVTSAVQTVRFGIETNWPASTPLDDRHVDLAVYYCGGGGRVLWDANPPPVSEVFEADEAHGYANENTRETMLSSLLPAYAFLGADVGETFWNFNQNQFPNELYLGVNAYGDTSLLVEWDPNDPLRYADVPAKYILIELIAVRGPTNGYFSVFQFGTTPTLYMSSYENGIDPTDRIYYAPGGHDHFNFAFTQAGLYEVDFRLVTRVTWAAPVDFEVLALERDGLSFDVITWPAQPCTRYTLQTTAALGAEWTNVAAFAGISTTEAQFSVTNISPAGASVCYRVLAAP